MTSKGNYDSLFNSNYLSMMVLQFFLLKERMFISYRGYSNFSRTIVINKTYSYFLKQETRIRPSVRVLCYGEDVSDKTPNSRMRTDVFRRNTH
jgi:hypothetical protein